MKKKLLLVVAFVSACVMMLNAASFKNETLHYVISYKWGLIHKDAGEATLTLRHSGQHYNLKLAAKTKPWADKIYRTRDTLMATLKVADLKPVSYTKITHEKDHHDRDEIKYSHYQNVTKGDVTVTKLRDGKKKVTRRVLTGSGPVFDMLSVFYYLRTLNYDKLAKNHVYKATVFSGKEAETITIRSIGKEQIKLKNKTTREAWHIRFKFTRSGGKKSSDDMDTWISTDAAHIPLYLVGKLPVGEVRAYLLELSAGT